MSEKVNTAIIVEVLLSTSPGTVWSALTEEQKMRKWFFDTMNTFIPEVGFETRFDVVKGAIVYPHLWKVLEVVPNRKLLLNWRYGGFPGNSYVTFELNPEEDGTKLTLIHEGTETFPSDNPDFSRESCIGGWNYFLNRLKEILEKSFDSDQPDS